MTATPDRPPFDLLDDRFTPAQRHALLQRRAIPDTLLSHADAARCYAPDADLKDAIQVALTVGAPLLLTGEPGTGKTQAAYWLALACDCKHFPLFVRSDHGAEDLLYRFDAVAYLHAANAAGGGRRGRRGRRDSPKPDRAGFIDKGPLWLAYDHGAPAVVLIDEIDKAHRDFPNDLLNVLDKHEFQCRETGEWVRRGNNPPPIVVVTSNRESRLPEPFLRRCIFHHIELNPDLVKRAIDAHTASAFPDLHKDLRDRAVERFWELRDDHGLRKPPATAELLVWLTVLATRPDLSAEQLDAEARKLPALSALVKDQEDRKLLEP
jgi:MoxR-like ATPase